MPSNIVNKMRKIGLYYLAGHSQRNWFHSNQALAQQICDFNDMNASNETLSRFLLEIYYQLPNFNGELAKTIVKFFQDELQTIITPTYLMENISVTTLSNIGTNYLANFPQPSPWYSIFRHTNQNLARSLKAGNNASNIKIEANAGYKNLWLTLIDFYRRLPNARGKLAAAIDRLMANVNFIYIQKAESFGGGTRICSTHEIADKMTHRMYIRWAQNNKPTTPRNVAC